MTDHIFVPPDSTPSHQISAQGIIYEVNYFFENENGDGGCFTVIGMSHDTPEFAEWVLETKNTGFKQRISISKLEDPTNISSSSGAKQLRTSYTFLYL